MKQKQVGQIKITRLTRRHVPSCEAIVRYSEPWKTLGAGIAFSRALAPASWVRGSVATRGRVVVGFVLFTPQPVFARGGYLRAIAVAPDCRRTGIGRALLEHVEEETERYARHLYLCVSSFNRKAQAFYRRIGYRKVGSIPGLIMPHASELIFWKRLAGRDHLVKNAPGSA